MYSKRTHRNAAGPLSMLCKQVFQPAINIFISGNSSRSTALHSSCSGPFHVTVPSSPLPAALLAVTPVFSSAPASAPAPASAGALKPTPPPLLIRLPLLPLLPVPLPAPTPTPAPVPLLLVTTAADLAAGATAGGLVPLCTAPAMIERGCTARAYPQLHQGSLVLALLTVPGVHEGTDGKVTQGEEMAVRNRL